MSFPETPRNGSSCLLDIMEVACWAHTRRHFHNALDTDSALMGAVPAYIAHLYKVENRAWRSAMWARTCVCLREHAAKAVLEKLHQYLEQIREEVLPKSEAGQAVAYALKNRLALTRYLEDGDLSNDNNHTKRSLRDIAIGRHNWTFVGSDRGGGPAKLRDVVRMAKVDPFAWFQHVLSRIGQCSIQQLDELLPPRWAQHHLYANRNDKVASWLRFRLVAVWSEHRVGSKHTGRLITFGCNTDPSYPARFRQAEMQAARRWKMRR